MRFKLKNDKVNRVKIACDIRRYPDRQFLFDFPEKHIIKNNKIIQFSKHSFFLEILFLNKCFVCGKGSKEAKFSDEHIVSDWILKLCSVGSSNMNLPNATTFTSSYIRYKVPCCFECNQKMSKIFEIPISKAFKGGYKEFILFFKKNPELIFNWLCLLFFKTHLKDYSLPLNQNRKLNPKNIMIGQAFYSHEELYHIHTMSRMFFTEATLGPSVMGSVFIYKMTEGDDEPSFDYLDNYDGKTIMLKIKDIGIVAALDDGKSCESHLRNLRDQKNPINQLQLREIFSLVTDCSIGVKADGYGAKFYYSLLENKPIVRASMNSRSRFHDPSFNYERFGKLMHFYFEKILEDFSMLEKIKKGQYSFIQDERGKLII